MTFDHDEVIVTDSNQVGHWVKILTPVQRLIKAMRRVSARLAIDLLGAMVQPEERQV